MLFITIGFDEILPASGWISSQNQKQRKRVTPEEPDEFPNHRAGGYAGWSLALFHEKYLKVQALQPDVITLESLEKSTSFLNMLWLVFKFTMSLWELLRLSISKITFQD